MANSTRSPPEWFYNQMGSPLNMYFILEVCCVKLNHGAVSTNRNCDLIYTRFISSYSFHQPQLWSHLHPFHIVLQFPQTATVISSTPVSYRLTVSISHLHPVLQFPQTATVISSTPVSYRLTVSPCYTFCQSFFKIINKEQKTENWCTWYSPLIACIDCVP